MTPIAHKADTLPLTLEDLVALTQRTAPLMTGRVPAFTKRRLTPAEEILAANMLRQRLGTLLSCVAAEIWLERGAVHLLTESEQAAFGLVVDQIAIAARSIRQDQ